MESRSDLANAVMARLGWTALDYEELCVLRCYAPEALTQVARRRRWELEHRLRRVNDEVEEKEALQFAPTLTREKVADLERRTAAGESLRELEARAWFAAVRLAEPRNRAQWRGWYERPIADSLFGPARSAPRTSLGGRQPRSRRVRTRNRARAPDDDEPAPPRRAASRHSPISCALEVDLLFVDAAFGELKRASCAYCGDRTRGVRGTVLAWFLSHPCAVDEGLARHNRELIRRQGGTVLERRLDDLDEREAA
jgi:hypothetical protein